MKELFAMKFMLFALLCLLALAPARADDGVDRARAYQAALPLYADTPQAPLHVTISKPQVFPNCRMTRFAYTSVNSQRVPALLFLPKTASATRPVPCVVVLHGLGGSKDLMAGFCRALAAQGFASCAIDLSGQGERAPAGQKGAVSADQLEQNLVGSVTQTTRDVRRLIDYLDTRHDIDPKRIGLAGLSLGAIIGTVASGVDTRIKATVLVSGGGGWGEILRVLSARYATYNGQAVTGRENLNWPLINALLAPNDPLTFAAHIAPRPLLMINGRQDTTIPPARAEALYAAAQSASNSHVRIDWLPQAGHLPPFDTIFAAIRQWLHGAL